MIKKRKYLSDTECGIRPINIIDSLPVKDLTDDEITKLFFARFDADALVIAYVDREGVNGFFGRVRKEKSYQVAYRKLLEVMNSLDMSANVDCIE